jgi:hypothetical protein
LKKNIGIRQNWRMGNFIAILLFVAMIFSSAEPLQVHAAAPAIPTTHGTALDGHAVELPRDLAKATVLILGFSRNSADATTVWEKAVRTSLSAGYFDMPMLASAPAFIRPVIVRSLRKQVPNLIWANFLPLTSDEPQWKQAAGFSSASPDAAYVLLVDRAGAVRWQTHGPLTTDKLTQLGAEVRKLTAEPN